METFGNGQDRMIKRLSPLGATLLLGSCGILESHKVEIANKSPMSLKNVRLSYADYEFRHDSLAVGDVLVIKPKPGTDGGVVLSYTYDDEVTEHQLGYATPAVSMECHVEVAGNDAAIDCFMD
jgi:hypothetical protein